MIKITIENISKEDYLDIIGCEELPEVGEKVFSDYGVEIVNLTSEQTHCFDANIWTFVGQFIKDIAKSIFASLIYEKLKKLLSKKPKPKLIIDNKIVEDISASNIQKALGVDDDKMKTIKSYFNQKYSDLDELNEAITNSKTFKRFVAPDYKEDNEKYYFSMEKHFEDIINFFKSEYPIGDVDFILANRGSINASVEKILERPVVVFDSNLDGFLQQFLLQVFYHQYSQDYSNEKWVNNSLWNMLVILEHFFESNCNIGPSVEMCQLIDKLGIYAFQAISLANAINTYIICHELGHIIAEKDKAIKTDDELEADKIGIHLFFELLRNKDQFNNIYLEEFAVRAPLLFFKIMNTVNLFKANIIESINYDESLLNRRDFILTSYVFNYSDGSSVISTLVEDCLNELNYIIKNKIPIKPID